MIDITLSKLDELLKKIDDMTAEEYNRLFDESQKLNDMYFETFQLSQKKYAQIPFFSNMEVRLNLSTSNETISFKTQYIKKGRHILLDVNVNNQIQNNKEVFLSNKCIWEKNKYNSMDTSYIDAA